MLGMKLLSAGLLFAGLACAQSFELRGSVTEPGVGGIPGIALHVTRYSQGLPEPQGPGVVLVRGLPETLPILAMTDARGDFRISLDRPGAYTVTPDLKIRDYYPVSIDSLLGRITVDAANPRAEVRMSFVRSGQITGLVLDEDTRQPVADYPVSLHFRGALQGYLGPAVSGAVTNRDGRFTATQLPPGEYVAGTRLPPGIRNQSAEVPDLNPATPGLGYSETFWPGGTIEASAALPVRLGSGGIVDIGTILLHKIPLYKLHITIPQGECPEGESVRVMLLQSGKSDPIRPPDTIRCGEESILSGFNPGSFTVYAVSDWQGERDEIGKAVWALAPVTITDKNEEVSLILQRGVIIEGRITAREGVKLPNHLLIAARPAELIPGARPPMEQFIEWTGDTTFRMAVHASPQDLMVQGLKSPLFVSEIRYSGAPVKNALIPVSAGAGSQTLEIVVDDKAATVSGNVIYGTKPPSLTVVRLEKWPISSLDPQAGVVELPVDNGQFRAQNVPPGDYRIVAITLSDRQRLSSVIARERLLADAQKITVTPGVSQTVTVRLAELGP